MSDGNGKGKFFLSLFNDLKDQFKLLRKSEIVRRFAFVKKYTELAGITALIVWTMCLILYITASVATYLNPFNYGIPTMTLLINLVVIVSTHWITPMMFLRFPWKEIDFIQTNFNRVIYVWSMIIGFVALIVTTVDAMLILSIMFSCWLPPTTGYGNWSPFMNTTIGNSSVVTESCLSLVPYFAIETVLYVIICIILFINSAYTLWVWVFSIGKENKQFWDVVTMSKQGLQKFEDEDEDEEVKQFL